MSRGDNSSGQPNFQNELLLSFEERIFEQQLNDCKQICKEYIQRYEDKEYWQKEMAAFLEEHSHGGQSAIQRAENYKKRTRNDAIPGGERKNQNNQHYQTPMSDMNQSFASFDNQESKVHMSQAVSKTQYSKI